MYFDTTLIDMHVNAVEAHAAACVAMEADFPGWEDREVPMEERRFVDASDVDRAGEYAVTTGVSANGCKPYTVIGPQDAVFN